MKSYPLRNEDKQAPKKLANIFFRISEPYLHVFRIPKQIIGGKKDTY